MPPTTPPPPPSPRRAALTRAVGLIGILCSLATLDAAPARGQFLPADSSIIPVSERGDYLFYRGRPYGNDATSGPLDVILNKGYAVAQFNNRNRYIFDYDYGARHAWLSITEFSENVERYGGWKKYIGDEIFPLSLEWREWKWMPNYFGHFLEGGMTYRRLAEWNRAHGVPLPSLSAGLVTMGAAVINEMYAHPGYDFGTAASATDMLLFDPLGIVVFSMDGVARFVAGPLRGNIWAGQAALTLDGELVNNGNNYVLKVPVGFDRASIFLRGGLAFTPGVTWHRADGLDVSVAVGGEGRIQNIDPETGEETPEIAAGGGIFIDRDGTLLGSLMLSETEHRRFVLNVYPGVLDVLGGRVGSWLIIRKDWEVRFGLSFSQTLGLGVGTGF